MKRSVKNYFILILLSSIIFLSFSLHGKINNSNPLSNEVNEETTLTILTRHDVTITDEFSERFLATPEAIALNISSIDFRYATTTDGWKKYLEDPSKSVDIAWGGGPAVFNTMENLGLLYHINPINDSELFTALNESVPPGNIRTQLKNFSDTGDLIWAANAISSFGFTVNHDFLDTYDLPIPTTWGELATPTYYISDSIKAISMADPPFSTSNTRIYQIILQAYGWEEGWKIITRMAANAGIYPGSIDTRAAVVSGAVGIALTIDFHGVIAQMENPNCEYIIPECESVISGDPIALGINVDDYGAAVAFVKFVSSPEGQTAWLTPGINRLPVNESAFHTPEGSTYIEMYELFNATLDSIQYSQVMFNETLASLNLETTIYYFHETLVELHPLLRTVWKELILNYLDLNITTSEFIALAELLGEPCMTLQESIDWNSKFISDPTFSAQKESEWYNCALMKYNTILNYFVIETPTPTPTSTETLPSDPTIKTITIGIMTSIIALVILRRKKKK